MAPTAVSAIGLGDTTKDVRPAGAIVATSLLIPLAFRSVTSRELSPATYVVSAALGAAGVFLSLTNDGNDDLQRVIVVVVPLSQLLSTIALNW